MIDKRKKKMRISRLVGCVILLVVTTMVMNGCSEELVPVSTTADPVTASVTEVSDRITESEASATDQATEEYNEPETTELPEPDIRKLTITATGDCALGALQTHDYGSSFHSYYDNYGEDYFMANFKDIFESDDFTLVNLECTLTNLSYDPSADPEKEYYIVGRPEYSHILSSSGVEACSLGNNHTRDVGTAGLQDTQAACDEAGLVWAYNDITGIYTTEDGYRIGIVSSNLSGGADREEFMRQGFAQLQEEGVDLLIACCHWGIEKEYYPTDYQIRLAHEFIDLGVDVIIGNHPHVLQGIEYYHGKIICYSFGNFCFGANRNPSDKTTMVYQQTFTFVDGQLQPDLDAHIIPARVCSVTDRNNFQPAILEGEEKADLIERMNTYSAPYSSLSIDADGVIHVDGE